MDAITLLKNDHQTVERLFKNFEKAGDRAFVEKRKIVDRIVEELSVHAAIEEQYFYPVARATVPGTEDIALESLEEHHVVKWLLSELDGMDPQAERFDAKVTVLIENVRHHVEEEESDCFPKVREALGRNDLADLGDTMAEAKKTAPTHPHPRLPDDSPGNGVTAAIASAADRVTDNLSGLAQGGVTAVADLISRITGSSTPKPAPTGSSRARGTADKVRRTADAAIDGIEDTAQSVAEGATSTAKTARAGAKGTATSTKRAAKSASTTAKRAATSTRTSARKAAKRTAGTASRAASKTKTAATSSR